MKQYTYYTLPGMGPGEYEETGTLFDLLNSVPYLLNTKRLPPLVVINSILQQGVHDSGMSGGTKWDPFTITTSEFEDLIVYCSSLDFEISNPPGWVTNRNYFQIWEFEIDHGVPAEEHKRLRDAAEVADRELDLAIEQGKDQKEIEKLHLEAYYAGDAVAQLMNNILD